MSLDKNLLFFYGLGCSHCLDIEKYVDRLIVEGFDIQKIEVWNNMENDKILEELDVGDDMCGGVPFFFNKNTNKKICGETTYKELRDWAAGK